MTDRALIERLEDRVDRLEAQVAGLVGRGPEENPLVRGINVRGWDGPPMVGKRMSECPVAFLTLYAAAYTSMAFRCERQGAHYNARLDYATAHLARTWRRKLTQDHALQEVG